MLFHLLEEVPVAEISVDLEEQVVHLPIGSSVNFPLDSFAKHCLLEGVDQMGYLIGLQDKTAEYEKVNGK